MRRPFSCALFGTFAFAPAPYHPRRVAARPRARRGDMADKIKDLFGSDDDDDDAPGPAPVPAPKPAAAKAPAKPASKPAPVRLALALLFSSLRKPILAPGARCSLEEAAFAQ